MNTRELSPALAGSAALHLAVAVALLISWPWARDLKVGSAVPVTIVSNAPPAELAPVLEAPETQTAQAETPAPDAPAEVTPPTPQPTPQPPGPKAQAAPPKPAPTPTPSPKPAAKPPAKAEKSLDLDALAASVSKMAKPSSAAKGPTRAATAPQATAGTGSAQSAAAMSGLAEELQRRWNPNCDVAGGRDVVVQVAFRLNAGGGVSGQPSSQIRGADTPASRVGADRAISAVYAAAPYRSLPREFYGQLIRVTFNAREACS